jgi:hypothetical protein
MGTRARITPRLLWYASIAESVPWPSASGATVKTKTPLINPPTVGTTINSQGINSCGTCEMNSPMNSCSLLGPPP